MPAPEQQIARLEFVVREQMKEIDKLREQVARLETGADAHTTLQAIYRNPASPEGNRIKAAAASLPIEKPKLMPERAPLELQAAEIIPLKELVRQRRERADRNALTWDPTKLSGGIGSNGADDSDNPDNTGD